MASDVSIARLALQHIGDRFDITSLDEDTPEAEQIKLVYDDVRDDLLRAHPWKWAKKFSTPASLTATAPGNWSYSFAYPSDCLRMLHIVNPLGDEKPPIRFEVGRNSDNAKVILCNESQPTFCYTMAITDPGQFDSQFVTAFSYLLARYVAMPLTGDRSIMAAMAQLAAAQIEKAKETDAGEGFETDRPAEADWITARA